MEADLDQSLRTVQGYHTKLLAYDETKERMSTFVYSVENSFLIIALTAISIPFVVALNKNSEFYHCIIRRLAQSYRGAIWLIGGGAVLVIILCVVALRAFPYSGDEYVYLFQADTFLAGRLWNHIDPLHQHFSFFHIFEKDGKWVGTFTPGWPLMLAAAQFIAIPPYAVAPICAALMILVAARLYRKVAGRFGAVVGIALMTVNAFFLLNGASYFSHISTALFATFFVFYGLQYLENPTVRSSLIAGSALGAVGLIRPYSAVLFAVPFAIELLVRRRYQFKMVIWIIVAVLPFVVALLAYNWAITGNPFLLVVNWGYPLLRLGLYPRDLLGDEVDLRNTSVMAVTRLGELALWTSPMLVCLYFVALYKKSISRNFGFYDFIFPMFIVGYLLMPAVGDNRYGPRYYFEAYPFLVLTIISAVRPYFTSKLENIFPGTVLAALVFSCVMIPIHVYENHQIVNERMKLYDAVSDAKLSHAVVILPTKSGSTLEMDLTRNGINPRDADVIFALDRSNPAWLYATGHEAAEGDLKSQELIDTFPNRNFYVYEQSSTTGQAILRKLAR